MTEHSRPDYEIDDHLVFEEPAQFRALFEPTRLEIIRLLGERAATVTELATTLERPKGTIAHHVDTLAGAGFVRVIRTVKVRALEAKYWGRTARVFTFGGVEEYGITSPSSLAQAAAEYGLLGEPMISTLRYARISPERAHEWIERLTELATEFTYQASDGDRTMGLALGIYRAERPHLDVD